MEARGTPDGERKTITALELLKILPDTPEHIRQELDLQTALGPVLMATQGYASPEMERAFSRARELCQRIGETPKLFPILRGLWEFYVARAELQPAHELGEQCLTLAQRAQDPALLLEAHFALGWTLFWLGELASVRAHVEQAIALYNPQQHRSHAFVYEQEPGVTGLTSTTHVLWFLVIRAKLSRESTRGLPWPKRLLTPLA